VPSAVFVLIGTTLASSVARNRCKLLQLATGELRENFRNFVRL
jgi:hypothetical protein